jgi:citronellol/citronellal dehydrogenase
LIDDTFLHEVGGVTDFERYRVDPSVELAPDFFVPDDCPPPPSVKVSRLDVRQGLSVRN